MHWYQNSYQNPRSLFFRSLKIQVLYIKPFFFSNWIFFVIFVTLSMEIGEIEGMDVDGDWLAWAFTRIDHFIFILFYF